MPDFNNERNFKKKFKDRFSSLENLVLIKNKEDETIIPKESEWFGFYEENGELIVSY